MSNLKKNILSKECFICKNIFTNVRQSGVKYSANIFLNRKYCSLSCSGFSQRGVVRSDDWKNKQSIAHKNFFIKNPKNLEKIANNLRNLSRARIGIQRTEETKKKISESQKGKVVSMKTQKRLSETHKGKNGMNASNWRGGISGTWGKRNPIKRAFYSRHRNYLKKKADGFHTFIEWETLKIKYRYMCLCCKRNEPEIKLTEDHIIPLSKGGSNDISNIQPLCISCNSRKKVNVINYKLNYVTN